MALGDEWILGKNAAAGVAGTVGVGDTVAAGTVGVGDTVAAGTVGDTVAAGTVGVGDIAAAGIDFVLKFVPGEFDAI